jgi:hypothetical protein
VHVTQTDPANTIDDATDTQARRQGERCPPIIPARAVMIAPAIAKMKVPRQGAGNKAIASPICIGHLTMDAAKCENHYRFLMFRPQSRRLRLRGHRHQHTASASRTGSSCSPTRKSSCLRKASPFIEGRSSCR